MIFRDATGSGLCALVVIALVAVFAESSVYGQESSGPWPRGHRVEPLVLTYSELVSSAEQGRFRGADELKEVALWAERGFNGEPLHFVFLPSSSEDVAPPSGSVSMPGSGEIWVLIQIDIDSERKARFVKRYELEGAKEFLRDLRYFYSSLYQPDAIGDALVFSGEYFSMLRWLREKSSFGSVYKSLSDGFSEEPFSWFFDSSGHDLIFMVTGLKSSRDLFLNVVYRNELEPIPMVGLTMESALEVADLFRRAKAASEKVRVDIQLRALGFELEPVMNELEDALRVRVTNGEGRDTVSFRLGRFDLRTSSLSVEVELGEVAANFEELEIFLSSPDLYLVDPDTGSKRSGVSFPRDLFRRSGQALQVSLSIARYPSDLYLSDLGPYRHFLDLQSFPGLGWLEPAEISSLLDETECGEHPTSSEKFRAFLDKPRHLLSKYFRAKGKRAVRRWEKGRELSLAQALKDLHDSLVVLEQRLQFAIALDSSSLAPIFLVVPRVSSRESKIASEREGGYVQFILDLLLRLSAKNRGVEVNRTRLVFEEVRHEANLGQIEIILAPSHW